MIELLRRLDTLATEWERLASDHAWAPAYRATWLSCAGQIRCALGHVLLAECRCICGAEHDQRGTGESGAAWFERHLQAVPA